MTLPKDFKKFIPAGTSKGAVVTWLTRSMPADLRAALKMFAAYHKITAEEAANILLTEALQVRGKVEGVKYV